MATDLKEVLAQAEQAYHRLMTGQSVVEFRDQNGETIRYSAVSAFRLQGYILDLQRQLGMMPKAGPMRAWF